MLHIVDQSPTRLIIRKQHRGLALTAGVLTALSVGWVAAMIIQATSQLDRYLLDVPRLVSLIVFLMLGVGLAALGAFALINISRGITLTLDKTSETVTLYTMRHLRRITYTYPIYGISHFANELNDELGVVAVYLVLRSGERVVLGTYPKHDQAQMLELMGDVRTFLHAVPTT